MGDCMVKKVDGNLLNKINKAKSFIVKKRLFQYAKIEK